MPSLRSRAIAAALSLARLRDHQFDPTRFTAPTAPNPARYAPRARHRSRVQLLEQAVERWPVFTIVPPSGGRSGQLLYLHGGAFAAEIQPAHWSLVTDLAVRTDRTVTVPIYPLVPAVTHRDVHPVLRRIYFGLPANGPVAVMGDSAGAALAMALVANLPVDAARPRDLVLLSPFLDLTLSDPAIPATDPLLRADHLRELGRRFAGTDGPDHPLASPLLGPLDDLGTVTVFTGTRDLLSRDARRLAGLAKPATGTTVTLHEFPGMIHDWMLLPVPEARTVLTMLTALLSGTSLAAAPSRAGRRRSQGDISAPVPDLSLVHRRGGTTSEPDHAAVGRERDSD